MLNFTLITVGSLKEDYLRRAVAEYEKRLSAYCRPNIVELKEVKLPDDPSKNEIAAALDTEPAEIAVALSATAPVTSLSDKPFEDDKGELGDRITDDESANEPSILTDKLALREAIGRMPLFWRKILLLRYYRDCTQQQTADLLGVSQVKISREEKKILTYLRGEMIV